MGPPGNDSDLIEGSGLFDPDWYVARYPDVAKLHMSPLEHFVRFGALLHRSPSTKFDTGRYLASHPEVAASGVNPVVHFLRSGARQPHAPQSPVQADTLPPAHVDVIVPVFNALRDVKRCLRSLDQHRDDQIVTVFVVNDHSDEATSFWLREFCRDHTDFRLIENPCNQGYTRSLNNGLRESTAAYVVALNSDTIVTPGWLRRLVSCARSDPTIGLVGPLSNAASYQNVPGLLDGKGAFAINELPAGMSPDELAAVVIAASKRSYPRLPFVNGFCYLIKRQVIATIGVMDDDAFPIAYGEENDYCVRAADAGFRVAIADDAYVFHAKSRSFGSKKRDQLAAEGRAALDRKHGGAKIQRLIDQMSAPQMDEVRRLVRQQLEKRQRLVEVVGAMRVLFLLPALGSGGGVHSVVQEVAGMRRLGLKAQVAVLPENLEHYLTLYRDEPQVDGIFVALDVDRPERTARGYDVVVATLFKSVSVLKRIVAQLPDVVPAYYVQDYEPLFFEPGSKHWQTARDSYTLIPNATLFAKTTWIANQVQQEHGVEVDKVEPSIDHDVYRPHDKGEDGRVHVAAMIRPQTPRRGAARTMRVLAQIVQAMPAITRVHLFGCPEEELSRHDLARDFAYECHGVLTRRGVAAVLQRADIFVDLSDYQAFGRTALEAFACGCTAVVPVRGGADEFAVDDKNAIVVDPLDEPACVDRLRAILAAPPALRRLQQEALRTAQRYSVQRAALSELLVFSRAVTATRPTTKKERRRKLLLLPDVQRDGRTPTGSAWVRVLLPYQSKAVARHWNVVIGDATRLPAPGSSDVVMVQRVPRAFSLTELGHWLQAWQRAGGKLIFELDDDLFDAAALRERGATGNLAAIAAKTRWLAVRANLVTVATEPLAKLVRPLNDHVQVVPNLLDEELWHLDAARPSTKGDAEPSAAAPVRIGFVGTPSHYVDLQVVREAVRQIQENYGDRVQVEVIGGFETRPPLFGTRVGLPKKHDYPHFVRWLRKRARWDVGLIPLVDDRFNECKSALKFLECAALDMALICSDGPTYRGIARDHVNALLVPNTTAAWHAALKKLIEDSALRSRLAAAAAETVRTGATFASQRDLHVGALAAAVEHPSIAQEPEAAPDGTVDGARQAAVRAAVRLGQQTEAQIAADAKIIRASALFDERWYLEEHQDVSLEGADPVAHYIRHGAWELRDPGPGFSTRWYVERYPDVAQSGINPLVHYLRYGRLQGRAPRPTEHAKPDTWWCRLDDTSAPSGEPPRKRPRPPADFAGAIARLRSSTVPPAIIVPVYNAADEVAACLESVLRHTRPPFRLIVIDDASPDAQIAELLKAYEDRTGVEVYRNDTNLGFTRTTNRGIELADRSDVVFLNSDTEVTPGWLRNLRVAAYSGERVGTATPFSNNAGAFSVPRVGENNPVPDELGLEAYGRAVSQCALRLYPSSPTGGGFCMYVRRACLDETGPLDAEAFPRAYGEENDFCMRAGRLGWRHVIDDATLVYHVRTASYGELKTNLMSQGREVLDRRYPDYTRQVRDFLASAPLEAARQRIATLVGPQLPKKPQVKPRVLYVVSTKTGGTPQTNRDLMEALADQLETFVLRCNARTIEWLYFERGVFYTLGTHRLSTRLKAFPHRSRGYDAVVGRWLVEYNIELIHIRHIAWHSLGLIDQAKALNLPVVFSFHDFYAVCPTVKLLDERQTYCAGRCTDSSGECRHELWREPDFPPLKHAAIHAWREQMTLALDGCDAFVTTSTYAEQLLRSAFPPVAQKPFSIIPHGRDFASYRPPAPPFGPDEVVRLVVLGNISKAKGGDIISELGRQAPNERLEIHLLGRPEPDVDVSRGVVVHGEYEREQVVERLGTIGAHLGGVFSIWPETYCHALTEMWAAGLPVIAFDFGAVAERIRAHGTGWLAPTPTAAGVLAVIQSLRAAPTELADKLEAVGRWQQRPTSDRGCSTMAGRYLDRYSMLTPSLR